MFLSLFNYGNLSAQNEQKYIVFFNDKDTSHYNPLNYLSYKAIQRRVQNNIPVKQYTDMPVSMDYIKIVSGIVSGVSYASRWFNALYVQANEKQILEVAELSFVMQIEKPFMQTYPTSVKDYGITLNVWEKDLLKKQTARMQIDEFHRQGITGKGIRVAIFDAGFPAVDESPVFESIRKNNKIIATYDFVKDKENVYKHHMHGTAVMSCIGGQIEGTPVGAAIDAEFLLARTEKSGEPFVEEEYWLAAAEWADKNGADIINSSLGYTFHRYFEEDMDGQKSFIARAANMAVSKGILVVNAMGNDGSSDWKYLGTPADADSVLSVGAINPDSDLPSSFSSYGPTADNRLKPNVCAYGDVIAAGKNALVNIQGTSFSSPLVAGFAACMMQAIPGLKVMDYFKLIQESASLYPYYDYVHGYGIPQASKVLNREKKQVNKAAFDIIDKGMYYLITLKDDCNIPIDCSYKYLYYNISAPSGVLKKYAVIEVYQKEVLKIKKEGVTAGSSLNVFYGGCYKSIKL